MKSVWLDHAYLATHGIPFTQAVQRAGSVVILPPNSIHAVRNGQLAVNYAWNALAKDCLPFLPFSCSPSANSLSTFEYRAVGSCIPAAQMASWIIKDILQEEVDGRETPRSYSLQAASIFLHQKRASIFHQVEELMEEFLKLLHKHRKCHAGQEQRARLWYRYVCTISTGLRKDVELLSMFCCTKN